MRGTICDGAHLFQLLNPECLDPIRQGDAHAGVILMVASPLDLYWLVVQEKTPVAIKPDRSDAKRRFAPISSFTAGLDRGHETVQMR